MGKDAMYSQYKCFEVNGMILKEDDSEFSLDEFLDMLEENGYTIGGSFKPVDDENEE